jgi:rRNA maturation endonuclease Nob1
VFTVPYCSRCGQKLEENFNFCPKCGVRTMAGTAAGVKAPWEAMREAFLVVGEEMHKAFHTAGEGMRKAATELKTEVQTHITVENISCSGCGAANAPDSKFCQKCGNPLS